MNSPINALARECYENAKAHGWHDEARAFPEIVALCHSELSEALESYRKYEPMEFKLRKEDDGAITELRPHELAYDECSSKPEGIAVEMADCIIRILDWAGSQGIDLEGIIARKHAYNKTRPYRHGNKKA